MAQIAELEPKLRNRITEILQNALDEPAKYEACKNELSETESHFCEQVDSPAEQLDVKRGIVAARLTLASICKQECDVFLRLLSEYEEIGFDSLMNRAQAVSLVVSECVRRGQNDAARRIFKPMHQELAEHLEQAPNEELRRHLDLLESSIKPKS